MSKSNVSMKVNGKAVSAEVESRVLLIHYLRENLGVTGPLLWHRIRAARGIPSAATQTVSK